jgi:hypothetical protein
MKEDAQISKGICHTPKGRENYNKQVVLACMTLAYPIRQKIGSIPICKILT